MTFADLKFDRAIYVASLSAQTLIERDKHDGPRYVFSKFIALPGGLLAREYGPYSLVIMPPDGMRSPHIHYYNLTPLDIQCWIAEHDLVPAKENYHGAKDRHQEGTP